MYIRLFKCFFALTILFSSGIAHGESINFRGGALLISKYLEIYEDTSGNLTIEEVSRTKGFQQSKDETPNMGLSQSAFWIRFSVTNNSPKPLLFLELAHPLIHSCELYKIDGSQTLTEGYQETDVFNIRALRFQNLVLNLKIQPGSTANYYVKIKGANQVIFPLFIRDQENLTAYSLIIESINGFFAGIILVMVLYNLFIYFSTRDRSYLFYVLYVLSVGLAQIALS